MVPESTARLASVGGQQIWSCGDVRRKSGRDWTHVEKDAAPCTSAVGRSRSPARACSGYARLECGRRRGYGPTGIADIPHVNFAAKSQRRAVSAKLFCAGATPSWLGLAPGLSPRATPLVAVPPFAARTQPAGSCHSAVRHVGARPVGPALEEWGTAHAQSNGTRIIGVPTSTRSLAPRARSCRRSVDLADRADRADLFGCRGEPSALASGSLLVLAADRRSGCLGVDLGHAWPDSGQGPQRAP